MIIEFRVWDKFLEKMLYPRSHYVSINRKGKLKIKWLSEPQYYRDFEDWCTHPFMDGDSEYLEIQQYTGINDKNGNKIYDGDILKIQAEEISVVKFNKYGELLGWNLMKYPEDAEFFYGRSPCSKDEVIGNIFEGIKNER